ncbi:hypothetical protein PY254_01890 [Rhodanobacter sp. AS-Z3]|uniref:pYEATS domain-containing protein n=1 Tax=Rhodanobacter sp. AS-Z3 TaxID=3031330 RepID=UPI00247A726F|nr:pYEATS domain-containing protein [Rhodanobacter sp. AS-Z3]WEN15452.1 hypothetical protein PY254_01890 [Rhodanobacter sp. AS-Z3]
MSETSTLLSAIGSLAWPIIFAVTLFHFRDLARSIIQASLGRVRQGDEIRVGIVTIGKAAGQLQVPIEGQRLTDNHFALIHRSWRSEKHDAAHGRPMYRFHVIVFGTPEALAQVEYVVYRLEDAYPTPVQIGGTLSTNFELNELANGYSLIRAEVYVEGQAQPVRLSRFIDLTDASPPLKGTYQNMAARA